MHCISHDHIPDASFASDQDPKLPAQLSRDRTEVECQFRRNNLAWSHLSTIGSLQRTSLRCLQSADVSAQML